jgi:hypothetical protein
MTTGLYTDKQNVNKEKSEGNDMNLILLLLTFMGFGLSVYILSPFEIIFGIFRKITEVVSALRRAYTQVRTQNNAAMQPRLEWESNPQSQ